MALVFSSSSTPSPNYYYFSPTVTTNPTNPNGVYKIVNSPPPQYVPINYPHQYVNNDGSIYYPGAMPIKRLFTDENGNVDDNGNTSYYPSATFQNVQPHHYNLHLQNSNNSSSPSQIYSINNTPLINGNNCTISNSSSFDSPNLNHSSIDLSTGNEITIVKTKKRQLSDVYDSSSEEGNNTDQLMDKDGLSDDEDEEDYPDEDDYQQELKQAFSPFVNSIFRSKSSSQLYPIIAECTKDIISFSDLLLKMKALYEQNYSEENNIYDQFLQILVRIDGDVRMVKYLQDNGVSNEDLEFVNQIQLTQHSPPTEAKKKRERMRKSSSRGIRSPPNKWTKDESQTLIKLVSENGDKQWKKIAAKLGGHKTGAQCAQHWKRVLSPEIKKGSWDEAEEELLFQLVEKHGQSWKNVAIEIKTRTDIQCRYQYFKAIDSRKTNWSSNEDEILLKKVKSMTLMDEKVSFQAVAKHLAKAKATKIPRTSLECKMRWNQLQQSNGSSSSSNNNYSDKFIRQFQQQSIDSSPTSFLTNNSFNDVNFSILK